MSMIYDNWERLVAAVLKRDEIWQLCHEHSRSPSICSESSDFSSSFRLSDVDLQKKEESVQKPVAKVVFLGSYTPGFHPKDILKVDQELVNGISEHKSLAQLTRDVQVSDQEFLATGTKVVLKLLEEVKLIDEEFKQQMKVLGNCRHANVSAPRAYYFANKANGMVIIYDYHSQGSLSDMLYGNKICPNWGSRVRIAIGAARGIAHIHKQFGGKLTHGNIKSSNVFLNSQHYGCVSDFDLSGIEIKAQGFEKDMHLVSWARSIRSQEWNSKLFDQSYLNTWIESVIREQLTDEMFYVELLRYQHDEEAMVRFLQIAMDCVVSDPKRRPKMAGVVRMLEEISEVETV